MANKKIIFNLFPDDFQPDAYAVQRTDSIKGTKADFYRTCFLSGILLHKIDNRLPEILTAILDEKVNGETLFRALQILDIGSEHRSIERPQELGKDSVKKAKLLFLGE